MSPSGPSTQEVVLQRMSSSGMMSCVMKLEQSAHSAVLADKWSRWINTLLVVVVYPRNALLTHSSHDPPLHPLPIVTVGP